MNKQLTSFLFFLLFNLALPSYAQWHDYSHVAMTTPIHLVFWEQDALKAKEIKDEVFKEFDLIEQNMSRYIEGSELSRINRRAFDSEVVISPSLFSVLRSAMTISELSHGAFDITFASIGYQYDFRKKIKPDDDEIHQNLDLLHYQNVLLNDEHQTVKFSKQGILLDLGGIAKGYAVDQGIAILKKNNIASAHLSAGGDMRLLGDKLGSPWIIGIRHPRDETKQSIVLPLSNTAISTSGDYERFFMDAQGERVHHILSPKTGKPAQGMQSVTILADETKISDGLSTAVFVLGVTKGLALVNKLKGVDAILIDESGRIHYSEGLMRP